ncbi:MAG: ATP-binding protein [Calditrichaeota bacterium]|nr:MAG: ATP-binding protein [Calditrichota bacterium]
MNKGQNAINEFVKVFKKEYSIENDLLINVSQFKTIDPEIGFKEKQNKESKINSIAYKYEFIFGDLPFGSNRVDSELMPNGRIKRNWNSIFESLKLLKDNGFGFFAVEPSILYEKLGVIFLKALEANKFFLNIVLDIPPKIYYPHTSFKPILIGFSKVQYDNLFISNIEEENARIVVENFKSQKGNNVQNGIWIEKDSFQSFSKYNFLNQIENLKTQYKEYKEYQLSKISFAINMTKSRFKDEPNSIYIQKIGNREVVSSLSNLKLKPHNHFQVVLNSEIVLAEYLALFYKSELGHLILNSLFTGSFIPSITKGSIKDSFVAIPNIEEQKLLIHTNNKLNELQKTINDLQLELSLNPKNAPLILEKFETYQKALKSLTVEDEILSLIRKGEGKTIEFKQTFSKNIHTNRKDPEIEKSSLKNIVGFLNSDGGTLLIGVADNSKVTGIEDDFFQSNDKYLLHFKNAVNSKIGSEFYPLIDYDIFSVLGKKILRVDCKPSEKACFFSRTEFYVRTNPATDRLEGNEFLEYVRRRFGN